MVKPICLDDELGERNKKLGGVSSLFLLQQGRTGFLKMLVWWWLLWWPEGVGKNGEDMVNKLKF